MDIYKPPFGSTVIYGPALAIVVPEERCKEGEPNNPYECVLSVLAREQVVGPDDEPLARSWVGYSVAYWEFDGLVVKTQSTPRTYAALQVYDATHRMPPGVYRFNAFKESQYPANKKKWSQENKGRPPGKKVPQRGNRAEKNATFPTLAEQMRGGVIPAASPHHYRRPRGWDVTWAKV